MTDFLTLETHYEMVLSGGETRKKTFELAKAVPFFESDYFFRQSETSDKRRLFDLTKNISEKESHVLYHRLDRLVLTVKPDWGVLKIGRQAVTWGNGMVFNPMDLFNPFSPTDIEREYKLGDDMLSLQTSSPGSGNLQFLMVARRDPETSDFSWKQCSMAAKYHLFLDLKELDILAARHYEDHVLGAGMIGYIGNAAWRFDMTYTLPDRESQIDDYMSFIANMDYSWVWKNTNFYGFIEIFYSGIGENDYQKAVMNTDILERLDRGELFTLGRTYLSTHLRVELHPLLNVFLTATSNTRDFSGFIQPRAVYNLGDNSQLMIGSNFLFGPEDSEFGGIKITGADFTAGAPNTGFIWISHYF